MANRAAIKNSKNGVAIVDSGASGIYMTPEAPKNQVNWSDTAIQVGTSSGQLHNSSASYKIDLPGLQKDLLTSGHVMPVFYNNLLGIGEFCDVDCKFLFTKKASSYLTINGSHSSQARRKTTAPNYETSPCYLMKMTPLCAINQNRPR